MSLQGIKKLLTDAGFPRVSGDEPSNALKRALVVWFSPRERG